MRRTAAEKTELICIAEGSDLPIKETLFLWLASRTATTKSRRARSSSSSVGPHWSADRHGLDAQPLAVGLPFVYDSQIYAAHRD